MNIDFQGPRRRPFNELDHFCKTYSTKQSTTNHIGNLCKFSCTKCAFDCNSWRLIIKHLNSKSCRYVPSLREFATKVTFHKCQVCDELVLCDKGTISNHLAKHKMTMSQYKVQIKMLPEDAWLSYWANPEKIIKEEGDGKIPEIKHELEHSDPEDEDAMSELRQMKSKRTRSQKEILNQHSDSGTKQRKSKKSTSGDQCSLDETSPWLKKALEEASVSDRVSNLCKYECPQCHAVYSCRESIYYHFKRTQHVTFTNDDYNKYLNKVVAHLCHICHKKIKCDQKDILYHVKSKHKINSLKEYTEKTNAVPNRQCLIETGQLKNFNNILIDSVRNTMLFSQVLQQVTVSNEIKNMCKYQCPNCQFECQSQRVLCYHFKKTKHECVSKRTICKSIVKLIAYECRICNKKMKCDVSDISSHIKNAHKITTLKQYSDKIHGEYENNREKRKEEFKKLCSSNLEKHNIKEAVGNFCKYSCKQCEYSCTSWRPMAKHIKAIDHGPVMAPTDFLTDVTFHKCHVCGSYMLCDNVIIRRHLRKHKLILTQYKELIKVPTED